MKRLIMLCMVLLLLSGCVASDVQPSLESEAYTQMPTLETTPGKTTVYTDYSKYKPEEAPTALYTRKEDAAITELKASDEYGAIYPFAGTALHIYDSADWGEIEGYLYGMTDEKGQVIVDPVYSSIELIYGATSQSYEWKLLPMWVLECYGGVNEKGYNTSLYAIATQDGSFATECKYSNVYGGEDTITAVELKDGVIRFDIFDMEGQLVGKSEDMPCLEGLDLKGSEIRYVGDMLYIYGMSGVYYCDLGGSLLLGPYDEGTLFGAGRCFVYQDDAYTMIDTQGHAVGQETYDYAEQFIQGLAIVRNWDGVDRILRNDGTVLLEGEENGSFFNGDDGISYSTDTASYFYEYADGQLNLREMPPNCNYLGQDCYHNWGENTVVNMATGNSFDCPTDASVYHFEADELFFMTVVDYETDAVWVINADMELLFEGPGFNYYNGTHFEEDGMTGTYFFVSQEAGRIRVYDREMEQAVIEIPARDGYELEIYDGRIIYTDERVCVHYNLEGELLFSYPLFSFGED